MNKVTAALKLQSISLPCNSIKRLANKNPLPAQKIFKKRSHDFDINHLIK